MESVLESYDEFINKSILEGDNEEDIQRALNIAKISSRDFIYISKKIVSGKASKDYIDTYNNIVDFNNKDIHSAVDIKKLHDNMTFLATIHNKIDLDAIDKDSKGLTIADKITTALESTNTSGKIYEFIEPDNLVELLNSKEDGLSTKEIVDRAVEDVRGGKENEVKDVIEKALAENKIKQLSNGNWVASEKETVLESYQEFIDKNNESFTISPGNKDMNQLEVERDMRRTIHKYMDISDVYNMQMKNDGSATFEIKSGKILYVSKLCRLIKNEKFDDVSLYLNERNELEIKLIK